MKRPDTDAILAPLKRFQRHTVDHAFERLFDAPDSTARFLVADEVGLGKTLIARGVIAKTIDALWDSVGRIDIVYVCSNAAIAKANLRKLRVGGAGDEAFSLSTRLTMLAVEMARTRGSSGASFVDNKVNLVSFTPWTSFSHGHKAGKSDERVLLYLLLRERWPGAALKNLLQGKVQDRAAWRRRLSLAEMPIHDGIRARFLTLLDMPEGVPIVAQVERAMERFGKYRKRGWPLEDRRLRNCAISALRQLLARVCIDALEPDLVILDEFQRFKRLLDDSPPDDDGELDSEARARALAQKLFNATTRTGNPVRTLLLSATPYKLYTGAVEAAHEDHYTDFIATVRFLLGGATATDRVARLKAGLAAYRRALFDAAAGRPEHVGEARAAIERDLLRVMSRTERVDVTADRQGMVIERRTYARLHPSDVRQYIATDRLFRAVGAPDPMSLWKSAPYLMHFMRGYRFDDKLAEAVEGGSDGLRAVLREHTEAFLDRGALDRYQELDPGNARLRELVAEELDRGQWELLWVPPTVPYWQLGGPYEHQAEMTKTLVFSAWNVVPDVISAVLSYEAERRAVGSVRRPYTRPSRTRLLALGREADGRLKGMRGLLLLYPCRWLADRAHPLVELAAGARRDEVVQRTRDLIAEGLAELPTGGGDEDERWYWAAPVLLDGSSAESFFDRWQFRDSLDGGATNGHAGGDVDDHVDDPKHFPRYVERLRTVLRDGSLGRQPDDLADVLVEVALGSPAVLAMRTMATAGIGYVMRARLAAAVAVEFWSLFNRHAATEAVRRRYTETGRVPFWRAVLRYAIDGNLQAVLDEYFHLVREQHAWDDSASADDIARRATKIMVATIRPKVSWVEPRFHTVPDPDDGAIETLSLRLRTGFALRYTAVRGDDGKRLETQSAVRDAFNSPFRPFVLASTSVGQEGLDFHPWCHRVTHWNLPGNPVDFEQREGRVHRYKGHAVRRNVARRHLAGALDEWVIGRDLWQSIFDLALSAVGDEDSGLRPYWIADGECQVERRVPLLSHSREVELFARLKRQLAAYRVVFGQPRQEELLALLARADLSIAQLREWTVSLRPPPASRDRSDREQRW